MRYQHRDGESATGAVSLTAVRDNVPVGDEGIFEVDEGREDFDDVHERLVEAGHTPVDDSVDDGDGDPEAEAEDADDASNESAEGETGDEDVPQASDYTETELVEMGYRELQSIATHYDDVDGSASADALTEALIEKRREETEAE